MKPYIQEIIKEWKLKFNSEAERRGREEVLDEIWKWAINNGITDKKSFVALRKKIEDLTHKSK